jgi:hypothetical protein
MRIAQQKLIYFQPHRPEHISLVDVLSHVYSWKIPTDSNEPVEK